MGNQQKHVLNRMPRARSLRRLGLLLLGLGLSACADSTTLNSPPSSRVLQRDYDKTLTKAEQQAVITDLQSATAKKESEAGGAGGAKTEAQPGQNTN
jgi:hypothetical protein